MGVLSVGREQALQLTEPVAQIDNDSNFTVRLVLVVVLELHAVTILLRYEQWNALYAKSECGPTIMSYLIVFPHSPDDFDPLSRQVGKAVRLWSDSERLSVQSLCANKR